MLGFRGRSDWHDMSDYLVHFTKGPPSNPADGYNRFLSILGGSGVLKAVNPFGLARYQGDSQRAVCFSEAPLGHLSRLVERRSHFGIGFEKKFLQQKGAAPVWYVRRGSPQLATLNLLISKAEADESAAIWRLTPFIDPVGGGYEFEWEREWRHVGDLRFTPSDVAFLLFDEANHSSARTFFRDAELNNEGPDYRCPFIDAHWSIDQIRQAATE